MVAAALIARRGRNTLILVTVANSWSNGLCGLPAFLSLEAGEVGVIGGGKRKPSGRIDVALIQKVPGPEG